MASSHSIDLESLGNKSISDNLLEADPLDLRSIYVTLLSLRSYEGEEEDDEEDDTDDEEDDNEENEDKDEDKVKIKDPEKKRLSDEAARHRREKKEWREKAKELERKNQEFESKDKSDSEKLQTEVGNLKKDLDRWKTLASQAVIDRDVERGLRNAGVTDSETIDIARYYLDKDGGLELDEDGEIEDLEERITALVKKRPKLVSIGSNEDSDEDNSNGSSGRAMNGKRKKDQGLDSEALMKRFPALRR